MDICVKYVAPLDAALMYTLYLYYKQLEAMTWF